MLEGVRPGSNCRAENTRESVSAVGDVSRSRERDWDPKEFPLPLLGCQDHGDRRDDINRADGQSLRCKMSQAPR